MAKGVRVSNENEKTFENEETKEDEDANDGDVAKQSKLSTGSRLLLKVVTSMEEMQNLEKVRQVNR